jgi:hypothetical protein
VGVAAVAAEERGNRGGDVHRWLLPVIRSGCTKVSRRLHTNLYAI